MANLEQNNVTKFFGKAMVDEVLSAKLEAADDAFRAVHPEPEETAPEEEQIAWANEMFATVIRPLAEEEGLPFTEEEYVRLYASKLSDEDLDQVAGGAFDWGKATKNALTFLGTSVVKCVSVPVKSVKAGIRLVKMVKNGDNDPRKVVYAITTMTVPLFDDMMGLTVDLGAQMLEHQGMKREADGVREVYNDISGNHA